MHPSSKGQEASKLFRLVTFPVFPEKKVGGQVEKYLLVKL